MRHAYNSQAVKGDSKESPAQDGHKGRITAVAFSPDNRWLATAAADQTVRLWSLDDDPQQYPIVLSGPGGTTNQLSFSPENYWLTATNTENQAYLWNLSATILIDLACGKVGRNLNENEWALYLPELRYNETCSPP